MHTVAIHVRSIALLALLASAAIACKGDSAAPTAGSAPTGATAAADPMLVKRARATAQRYAFEAYPSWAVAHPDKACPGGLDALFESMTANDKVDPWGKPYVLLCGAKVPPGVRGVGVVSAGPDGKLDTDDDIKSWK